MEVLGEQCGGLLQWPRMGVWSSDIIDLNQAGLDGQIEL